MPEFSRSCAVVIGINNYAQSVSPLHNAVNDAKHLVQILREQHGYQVWLLLDEVATRKNINTLLQTLSQQIKSNDRLLFYFAGHGIALNGDDGPEGYLIPQDAKLGDMTTYLPMTQVQKLLSQLACRHFLGVFDCCFAGAFRWSSTRDLLAVPEVIHKERYDRFITDPAWQVITSAAYDQKASDAFSLNTDRGQIGEHSPFAAAFIEALGGKADIYPPAANNHSAGDGVITATELYLYLRDRVEGATEEYHQRQTPGIWPLKKHDKGEYIFLSPGHELNLPPAPPLDESKNPYRGLESFDEEHSKFFFGRQALTEQLYQQVSEQPLTIVLGASGSGKSSLVKAGLIPYAKHTSNQQWQILAPMRPGESPLKALNNTLAELPVTATTGLTTEKGEILARIAAWMEVNPSKLLLVIDQFEELLTLCQEDERENFLNLLAQAISQYPQLRIVLTLRSDFEPQFGNTALKPYWTEARFSVQPMTRVELRSCIEEPASARVMYFKSDNSSSPLIDQLIDEVADAPGRLPLLSFTLSELYLKYLKRQKIAQDRGETIDRAITEADYKQLGGVMQSLTQRADSEYEELVKQDRAYKRIVRNVMLRMVVVDGGGGESARRRVPLSELEYPAEDQRVKEAIRHFTAARLLVEGQDTEGTSYVEPAHDALVNGWQKLLAWRQEQAESLILQRRLTPAAEEWKRLKSREQSPVLLAKAALVVNLLDRSLYFAETLPNRVITKLVRLWRRTPGDREQPREKTTQFLWNANPYLDVLNEKLKSDDNWFNQVEAEFVQRSVVQKRWNISWRGRIAVAVFLGLSVLTGISLFNLRATKREEASAYRETAEVTLRTNQTLEALIASLKAGHSLNHPLLWLFPPDPQLREQVRETLQRAVYTVKEINRLDGHRGTVRSSLSRDGMLATAGEDDTVNLWNLQGQRLGGPWKANQRGVNNVSFSPNGKLFATAGEDGTVHLWDLQGQKQAEWSANKGGRVRGISFSPNGQLLATAGEDSTVRLWNLQGTPVGAPLRGFKGEVWVTVFSPNGNLLASVGDDGFVHLWNLQKRRSKIWKAEKGELSSIKFSPDGQRLATVGEDRIVRLWSLQGQRLAEGEGHQGRIWNVEFSPDGQFLASAAGDGTARLWDLRDLKDRQMQQIDQFEGHQGPVRTVIFSRDGQLVTAGDDSTVRLWNLQGQQSQEWQGANGDISSIKFSPDGQRLASGGDDGAVRLWNLQGQKMAELRGHQGPVRSVSFSPDGQQLVSGGDDGYVRLRNLHVPQQLQAWKADPNEVRGVSFSPNGQQLATVGNDSFIHLWNLHVLQQSRKWWQRTNRPIRSVSFSPDGQQLATAGDDSIVHLWNLQGEELHEFQFQGHIGPVFSVAFSPNGKQLASRGQDATVRLWNLQTYQNESLFQSSGNKVSSVAFSPDGKMIVSSSGTNDSVYLLNSQGHQLAEWRASQRSIDQSLNYQLSVYSVSFSPDSKLLATAGDGTIKLWRIESFDELMNRSCNWIRDYLKNDSKLEESDRHLCDS